MRDQWTVEKRKRGNWGVNRVRHARVYATLELSRHVGWVVVLRFNDYWSDVSDKAYGFDTRAQALAYAKDWITKRA